MCVGWLISHPPVDVSQSAQFAELLIRVRTLTVAIHLAVLSLPLPIDDAVEQLKCCLTPSRYHIDVRGMADKSSPRRSIKICAVHRTFDAKLDSGNRSQSPDKRELLPFLLSRLIPAVSGV